MFLTARQIHAGGNELQDRAEITWLGSNLVMILADGAGGQSGGAEAAEFIIRHAKQFLHSVELSPKGLVQFLEMADQQMIATGKAGETTCVICVVSQNGVVGASVGDSGAWFISEHGVDNLTNCQIRKPFLGSGGAMPVGFAREAQKGTLLLASDGLLKYTSADRIVQTVLGNGLEDSAKKLVELVRYASGALPDDISILLARPG